MAARVVSSRPKVKKDEPSATLRTPTRAPGALVAEPGVVTRGRARTAPLRREGPEKLTGTAKFADDLVFPGAWYGGTIRSTEPHARFIGLELDEGFDWSKVVGVTAD